MKKIFALTFGLMISNLISAEARYAYTDDEYDFYDRDEDRNQLSQRRREKNDWWNENLKKSQEQDEYRRRRESQQRLEEEFKDWRDWRQKREEEEEKERQKEEQLKIEKEERHQEKIDRIIPQNLSDKEKVELLDDQLTETNQRLENFIQKLQDYSISNDENLKFINKSFKFQNKGISTLLQNSIANKK